MVTEAMTIKPGTNTSTTATSKVKKTCVYLDYACYTCGNKLSSAKTTINHCHTIHGYILPTRRVGQKRPQVDQYEYVRAKDQEVDEFHYACPSCWFHCPELEDTTNGALIVLNDHIREEHHPQETTESRPLSRGDESRRGSTSTPKSPRSRASSTASSKNNQSDNDDGGSKDDKNKGKERQGSSGSSTPKNKRHSFSSVDEMKSITTKLDELTNLFKRFFTDT